MTVQLQADIRARCLSYLTRRRVNCVRLPPTLLKQCLNPTKIAAVRTLAFPLARRVGAVYISSLLVFLAACDKQMAVAPRDQATSIVGTSVRSSYLADRKPSDSAAVDSLARYLALALSDAGVRKLLLEDLRDSPFPLHRIHLASYLQGTRGRTLAVAMSSRSNIASNRVSVLSGARGGLQLVLRRSVDRTDWTGTPDIAVKGVALTLQERAEEFRKAPHSEIAYSTSGQALQHGLLTDSKYPVLEITAPEVDFGVDPEGARRNSPRMQRATVSTSDEERVVERLRGDSLVRAGRGLTPMHLDECPPEGCGGGGPPRPMGVSIPSGKDYAACYKPGVFDQTVDRDQDGVDDTCEYELAIAFRPQLMLMWDDCDTRREAHFAVRQKNSLDWGGVIYIFYALSYVYDCGPPFWCPSAYPDCNPHLGDSEWIILEVGPSPSGSSGPWALKYGTLSAHWRSPNDQTAGYEASDLEDADNSPGYGAPRIWVAQNKHGNYRTQGSCDGSGWFNIDNCDRPQPYGLYNTLDFQQAQNLGRHGLGTEFIGSNPASPVYDRYTGNGHYEFFWDPNSDFCGWFYYSGTNASGCSGSYYISLTAYGM